jgi:GH3 auxin-responsive promoter
MNIGNADILIGQLWRAASHVRYFRQACQQPLHYQTEKLLKIVRANQQSAFGKAHHFDRINSVTDFQKYVPANRYEDLEPYITALSNGARSQLTVEEPFMFATTSGTTATPKYIPITNTHLQDYTHAFQVHNYHLIRDFSKAALGKFLVITSNDDEGQVASGTPYGAISGLLSKRQSPVISRHFAQPYELCKIKNVDSKYYLMLRCALAQNVTAILACNPSSLLLLAAQMKEHAQDLVADIFDGTIRSAYAPPKRFAEAFSHHLVPNRQRARQLEDMLARDGYLQPKNTWKELAILSCWKGGPMSFYLGKLPEHYGAVAIRDLGYMASEGRGSIPISDRGAGGVTAITSHFFEFVHEDDMENTAPKFLTIDQLALHERYYIYFTTSAGLYRYNINDIVQVTGFAGQTPIIEFVRKGLGISSITGEKLTEEQVSTALAQVGHQLSLKAVNHFTAEVKLGDPPSYVCFVELGTTLAEPVQEEFVRLFDQSLRMQNSEYEDKRSTKRLGMPSLRILPAGTYTRLRQQRVSAGAPEAQVKIPLLSIANMFSGQLASLGVN